MNSILFTGVNKASTDLLKRKVSLTNLIGLLVGCLTLPFVYVFSSAGAGDLGLLCIPFSIVFFLSILFNKLGWFTIARFSILISWSVGVLFYTLELGTNTGIQNCYFVLICLSLIMFLSTEAYARVFSVVIPLVCYFSIEFNWFSWERSIVLSDVDVDTIRVFVNPTIFIQLIAILWYYSAHEKRLIQAVENENYKNHELTKSQKALYKSTDQLVDQQNELFGAMSKSEQTVLEVDEKGMVVRLWTQSQNSQFKTGVSIREYLGDQVELMIRETFQKWERDLDVEQKESFMDSGKKFKITLVKSQGSGEPKATMFIRKN